MITRRQALMSTLLGAGGIGLRALATGLPAAVLLNPRRALASPPPVGCAATKAQFIILNTSGNGDPINASVPGTYLDPKIAHSLDPTMAPTPSDDPRPDLHGGCALGDAPANGARSNVLLAHDDQYSGASKAARRARS